MLLVEKLRTKWYALTTRSQFGSYVALTLVVNIALVGVNVLSGMLVARTLGPAGRGELSAIQNIPVLLSVLATFGVNDALAYYCAKYPEKSGRYFSTALCITLAGCLPFALIGYWGMPLFLHSQSHTVIAAARTYLWYLPASILVGLPAFPLRGGNELVAWNILRFIPGFAWLLIVLGSFITQTATPAQLASTYLLVFALTSIFSIGILLVRIRGAFAPQLSLTKPLLHYGFPLVLSTLPSTFNFRLDQMLMAGLLEPRILGLYLVAVAWSSFSSPIVSAICVPMIARVAAASPENQNELLAQSTRFGSIISFTLAIISALLAPLMVPLLFGKAFALSVPAAILLCFAGWFSSLNQLLNSGAMAIGSPRFVLIGECVGLVATLLLLYFLLPPYKIIGAAVASLLSYGLTTIVLTLQILRKQQLSVSALLMPRIADFRLVLNRTGLANFPRFFFSCAL